MKTELKDVIHFYYGQNFWDSKGALGEEVIVLSGINTFSNVTDFCDEHGNTEIKLEDIKPLLRPLSSMTKEENSEYEKIGNKDIKLPVEAWDSVKTDAAKIKYLLSKGFDLFNLIETKQAMVK